MATDPDKLLAVGLGLAWAALPLTVGAALAPALAGTGGAVPTVAGAGAWAVWAVVVLAVLVPHPLGLTALRVAAPAAVVAAAWSAARPGVSVAAGALAVAGAALAAALAAAPSTGVRFVNGPAYPDERRLPLRVPGPILFGPLPVAWLAGVTGLTSGPLLLAAGRTGAGVAATVVGVPVALLLLRALHGLSRRWLVFVPAGVVLHDPLSLVDPVLFRRETIESLRLAPEGSDSLDLTRGALGLACELVLREKVAMTLRAPADRSGGDKGASARLLFTPTRPGAALAEAAGRRVPTG